MYPIDSRAPFLYPPFWIKYSREDEIVNVQGLLEAIFDEDELPSKWDKYLDINADFFE